MYIKPRSPEEFIIIEGVAAFHPNDNSHTSADIAAFDITARYDGFVKFGYEALAFDRLSSDSQVSIGTPLVVEGYSISYLERSKNPDSDAMLAPERIPAVLDIAPLDAVQTGGFSRQLVKKQFARSRDGKMIGSGTSGGPVFRASDAQCVGILASSVEIDVSLTQGMTRRYRGGALVPSALIRETILHAVERRGNGGINAPADANAGPLDSQIFTRSG